MRFPSIVVGTLLARAACAATAAEFASTSAHYRVLFTGFGPFLNYTTNPTMQMALALQRDPCHTVDISATPGGVLAATATTRVNICFDAHVLPVNRTGAMWTSEYLGSNLSGNTVPFDMVLHTGLENTAKGLVLEVAASNQQANDTGGPSTLPAIGGAPWLLPTTVNLGWMALDAFNTSTARSGSPALFNVSEIWSRDAGDYYCNEVLYRTLHFVRTNTVLAGSTGALLPAMFVHSANASTTSLDNDLAVVLQVAAHALWATYEAPHVPHNGGSHSDKLQIDKVAAAGVIAASLMGGMCLLAGLMLVVRRCCGFREQWGGVLAPPGAASAHPPSSSYPAQLNHDHIVIGQPVHSNQAYGGVYSQVPSG